MSFDSYHTDRLLQARNEADDFGQYPDRDEERQLLYFLIEAARKTRDKTQLGKRPKARELVALLPIPPGLNLLPEAILDCPLDVELHFAQRLQRRRKKASRYEEPVFGMSLRGGRAAMVIDAQAILQAQIAYLLPRQEAWQQTRQTKRRVEETFLGLGALQKVLQQISTQYNMSDRLPVAAEKISVERIIASRGKTSHADELTPPPEGYSEFPQDNLAMELLMADWARLNISFPARPQMQRNAPPSLQAVVTRHLLDNIKGQLVNINGGYTGHPVSQADRNIAELDEKDPLTMFHWLGYTWGQLGFITKEKRGYGLGGQLAELMASAGWRQAPRTRIEIWATLHASGVTLPDACYKALTASEDGQAALRLYPKPAGNQPPPAAAYGINLIVSSYRLGECQQTLFHDVMPAIFGDMYAALGDTLGQQRFDAGVNKQGTRNALVPYFRLSRRFTDEATMAAMQRNAEKLTAVQVADFLSDVLVETPPQIWQQEEHPVRRHTEHLLETVPGTRILLWREPNDDGFPIEERLQWRNTHAGVLSYVRDLKRRYPASVAIPPLKPK